MSSPIFDNRLRRALESHVSAFLMALAFWLVLLPQRPFRHHRQA